MTKYYVGEITECTNGYEFSSKFLFKVNDDENLDEVSCGIERDYRPECENDIRQKDMEYYEITEEEFNVMSNHLFDLSA